MIEGRHYGPIHISNFRGFRETGKEGEKEEGRENKEERSGEKVEESQKGTFMCVSVC